MALFVLIVVGLVVAQTWLDWRDAGKNWVVPEWARGMALAGVIAISLAAATSFASSWLLTDASDRSGGFGTPSLWFEAGFLACAMGIIVFATRKRRHRLALIFAGALVLALCVGLTFWL